MLEKPMKGLVTIEQLPDVPPGWNYQQSVAKVKQVIYKLSLYRIFGSALGLNLGIHFGQCFHNLSISEILQHCNISKNQKGRLDKRR